MSAAGAMKLSCACGQYNGISASLPFYAALLPPLQVLPPAGAACEGRMLVHITRAERTEQQAEGCGAKLPGAGRAGECQMLVEVARLQMQMWLCRFTHLTGGLKKAV